MMELSYMTRRQPSPSVAQVVAANIRRLRDDLGVTQEGLAGLAKISPFSISRYEGGGMPGREEMVKLAEAFGLSSSDDLRRPNAQPDPRRRRTFRVKVQIIGNAPAGLREALDDVIARYERAAPPTLKDGEFVDPEMQEAFTEEMEREAAEEPAPLAVEQPEPQLEPSAGRRRRERPQPPTGKPRGRGPGRGAPTTR